MAKALMKRFALLIITLILTTLLAFLAFSVIPGDPTSSILGVEATEEQIAALRAQFGLDAPVWQRYLRWVGNFLRGDFGQSYAFSVPVGELLAPRAAVTLSLSAMAMVLIVVISVPVGILSARFAGGKVDRVLTVGNQVVMSIPNFLLGIALTYVFGLVLKWFTPGLYTPPEDGLWQFLKYLFFPALSIALPKSAMTVRLLRSGILSELRSDYVRTAYSRGCSKSAVLWRHVLRNAMIPVITFLAMAAADMIAGSVVAEQVFAMPGLGQMLVRSIGNRDYPVVQAIVVLLAAAVVLCNFLGDLLYRVVDPRLRRG